MCGNNFILGYVVGFFVLGIALTCSYLSWRREHINYKYSNDIKFDLIMWLKDPIGYRTTGRSRLIAKVYIAISMKYPGLPVYPQDHSGTLRADKKLIDLIIFLVNNKLPELKDSFEFHENYFICKDSILYKKYLEVLKKL